MATLIEQVEASMKLCAALERRVAALEKVVGKDGRTDTADPLTVRTRKVQAKTHVTRQRGNEIRNIIVEELRRGPTKTRRLRQVTGINNQARLSWYLVSLRREGAIENAGMRGRWKIKQSAPVAA